MNKLLKIVLCLSVLIGTGVVSAEDEVTMNHQKLLPVESIIIGEKMAIYSHVLAENRIVQIALPASYAKYPDQTYPVLYLLDGESNFHYLTGIISRLTRMPYPSMPEMIIVGINNTNRTRDLTPSVVLEEDLDDAMKARVGAVNGGNPAFFQFLDAELIPAIEAQYRTADLKIMIGHSFGGITALNHLINSEKKMNAYIAHDPSMWWDDGVILKRYEALEGQEIPATMLFISQAGDGSRKGKAEHYGSISALNQYLDTHPIVGLDTTFTAYPNEDHGSVIMPGNIDALKLIFEDIQLNIKSLPDNPELIKTQYALLSEKLGTHIQPSEAYLSAVMDYFKKINRSDLVEYIQHYMKEISPEANAEGENQL